MCNKYLFNNRNVTTSWIDFPFAKQCVRAITPYCLFFANFNCHEIFSIHNWNPVVLGAEAKALIDDYRDDWHAMDRADIIDI